MIDLNHSRNPAVRPSADCLHVFLLLSALIVGLGFATAGRVTAQTFTVLHAFTATNGITRVNSDGYWPYGRLILGGNTLYGTAHLGGSAGNGTVFKLNTDGTGFTTLYSFTATGTNSSGTITNTGGRRPLSGLVLAGNTLYGAANFGGDSGVGTLFKVNTDGTGFTNLHNFTASPPYDTNSDGMNPHAGLTLSGNTLYGAATFGGTAGNGTVFAINSDGTGFTNLHTFAAGSGSFPNTTNTDRADPFGKLILSGGTLYGTTAYGGSFGGGAIFALNTDGSEFTNLHSFEPGFNPVAELTLAGSTLYGTALNGGSGLGAVFSVSINGTGFTNLHAFTPLSGPYPYTNSDGDSPRAGLVLSGHTLYGTTEGGGLSGDGTVFALNTDGTGFRTHHSFTATNGPALTNSDGAATQAGLILSGNTLYGTARQGGSTGNGTIFSVSLPAPQLTIRASGTNVILTWPTDNAGFDYTGYALGSATNDVAPVVWTTNSPAPIVVNGQITVTNPITGTQQFFRLSQ